MGNNAEKADSIRRAPRTDDERWKKLLELMSVPTHPGVYVLGCYARHVTFYSQQVRALNLVEALCKTGAVAEGGTVGVVGAGLAGLTAAAGALRRGLGVHLFQKDNDPEFDPGRMPLQTNSGERWVDPFVYDWPLVSEVAPAGAPAAADEKSPRETSAGLPLLNWKAGRAAQVRGQILEEFENVLTKERERRGRSGIEFHKAEVKESHLARDGDGRWLVDVGKESGPVAADVLILAVGFGVEERPPTKARYWTNDGLDSNQADGRCYLVSGAGDGGVTDLMRLCIADFKHRTVLDMFKNAGDIGSRLEKAVKAGHKDLHKYFVQEAQNISVSGKDEKNLFASRENEVYLTASPEKLFGPESGASILNRLVVAWLFRKGRFKLIDAKLRLPLGEDGTAEFTPWDKEEVEPNPTVLSFRAGDEDPFAPEAAPAPRIYDEVVVRHGPGRDGPGAHKRRPVEDCFPTLWKEGGESRRFWKEMPHWDDWTRQPFWRPEDFADPPPPLDPPVGKGTTYLVAEHPKTGGIVRGALESVVDKLHERDGDAPPPTVVALNLEDEFRNPHRFGRAVRALCRADVAVFDLSEERRCPEAYIMLGVRSVARRGITIVTTRFKHPSDGDGTEPPPEDEPAETPSEPSDAPFAVPEMPFLLRDINFCGWGKDEALFIERLRKAIEEGRARARRLGPIYRDLPAYEEVRQLGPRPEDYRLQTPEEVVLFLSPLDKKYREEKGSWLRARAGASRTGMYIVESPSPERTSLKLYNAIRRTQLCVIDWTERRPNVFFELGVRLAVSALPPVCVIHKNDPWASLSGGVLDLFRPLVYDAPGTFEERKRVAEEMAKRKKALGSNKTAAEWPLDGATLSPSFVYEQVRASIPAEEEDWNVPVWKELRTRADLILGSQPIKYRDPLILFGDDPDLKGRAGRSGYDRLFAAWYFLERRYDIRGRLEGGAVLDAESEPWKSWLEIGTLLWLLLKDREADADYVRMHREVGELLDKLKANVKASRGGTR